MLVPPRAKHSDEGIRISRQKMKKAENIDQTNEIDDREKRLEDAICNQEPDYTLIKERGHSELAVELVQKLLKKDPDTRLTMKAANIHPWFTMRMEVGNWYNQVMDCKQQECWKKWIFWLIYMKLYVK